MAARRSVSSKNSPATIGFEAKLCLAADKLGNNMDAAEYKPHRHWAHPALASGI